MSEENSILVSLISRMNQTQSLFQPLKWGDINAISNWKRYIHSHYKDDEEEEDKF